MFDKRTKMSMMCMMTVIIFSCLFLFSACESGDDDSEEPFGEISMKLDGENISITGKELPEIWGMAAQQIHYNLNGFGTGATVIHRRYNASVGFTMIFYGQESGTYNADSFSFQWDGIQYWHCDLPDVTVQEYDDAGGRISGTFSEVSCDANPNTTPDGDTWSVTVTDGEFDVLRVEDDLYK